MCPLGQIARLERGRFSARPRNDPKYYGGDTPFIQTGDVRSSAGLIESYSQTLNSEGMKVSKVFPAGTLFLTIAANVGDLGITQFASACPDSLVAIRPLGQTHQKWLYYALSAQKRTFESLASQNAQANLNLAKLNPFPVLVPPYGDQIAIAEALGEADDYIRVLNRLLRKKKAMLRGMEQFLLAGRTRLPGFVDPWPSRQLSELATGSRGAGLSKSMLSPGGERACVLYGELFTSYGRVIDEVISHTSAPGAVTSNAGQVLLPGSTTTVAADLAVASAILVKGVLLGGDINIITPDLNRVDPVWLAYFLTSQRRRQIAESAQGITISHLYVRDVLAIEVPLPSLDEQRAIATALADTESETARLGARLRKARNVKAGMMQELLTGRTRLPIEEGAA